MEQPLGRAVGNAIEVNEAVDVLQGKGPPAVRELTLLLAEAGLQSVTSLSPIEIRDQLNRALDSGAAYEAFVNMVRGQHGAWNDRPLPVYPGIAVTANSSGYFHRCDGFALGNVVIALGGGRRVLEDKIDPAAGLMVEKKIGDRIEQGEVLAYVHAPRNKAEQVIDTVRNAFTINESPCDPIPMVLETI